MFPIKHEHEHFLSIFCWIHHVRPCFGPVYIFLLSEKKPDISKFSFSAGSSFPKLLNLWVETQSRDPAMRGTEDHWDYEEAVRPFRKALTVLLSPIAVSAGTKCEPCAAQAEDSAQLNRMLNWMWGDAQEVSNLGSIWVLEMGYKSHCILSMVFGFTIFVLQHNFSCFQ